MFSPRTASQVDSLAGSLRQQEQTAAEWAQFVADLQAAQQQAREDKPAEAAWRAGPHGSRLAAVAAARVEPPERTAQLTTANARALFRLPRAS